MPRLNRSFVEHYRNFQLGEHKVFGGAGFRARSRPGTEAWPTSGTSVWQTSMIHANENRCRGRESWVLFENEL